MVLGRPERLIYLTQKDEPGVRGDGGVLKIDHDGAVKIRPDCLLLAFHHNGASWRPQITDLFSFYQMV